MLFNSVTFLFFFILIYCVYLLLPKWTLCKIWLLIVSYVFYAWWDVAYTLLIFAVTTVNYIFGILIDQSEHKEKRKLYLGVCITLSLGPLAFWKYSNFIISNFHSLLWEQPDAIFFNLVLPVGISFFTFQAMSYSIDIYLRKIKPVDHILDLYLFISFFPQLVAGPIVRAASFLPQLQKRPRIEWKNIWIGIKRIVEGFFLKMVIADNLSVYVNSVYSSSELSGGIYWAGTILFSIQILGDFAGYSQIARGLASLMGFDIQINFNYPYISKGFSDFWSRWHISLSTWFRDYLYIPLGGNRIGHFRIYFNGLAVMTISGLWHGANWTFIVWGFLHGIYWIGEKSCQKWFQGIIRNRVFDIPKILITFVFVNIAWVFFRSPDIQSAFHILSKMLDPTDLLDSALLSQEVVKPFMYASIVLMMHFFRYLSESRGMKFEKAWIGIPFVIILILVFQGSQNEFIYFQF